MSIEGEEPSAASRAAARVCRDMYVGLIAEGFTESQALKIIGAMIAATGNGGSDK